MGPSRRDGASPRRATRRWLVLGGLLGLLLVAPASGASASGFAVSTTALPVGEVSVSYYARLETSGGVAPYTWTALGALPTGLSLSRAGVLSGAPRVPYAGTVRVAVRNGDLGVADATLPLTVGAGPSVTTTSLPGGVVGDSYDVVLAAQGGTPPYLWSIASGPIPGGLLLSSTGELSGRPGAAGTSAVALRVTDARGASSTVSLDLTVAPPPPPPEQLAIATVVGHLYRFGASGPASLTVGSPPERLAAIAAAPTAAGYWVAAANGRVFGVGVASLGSIGRRRLGSRVVGIAAAPTGAGYWLVTEHGRVYGFGRARSLGSIARSHLRSRVVGIAAAPTGAGYWLVTEHGRVFGFGRARRLHPPRRVRGRIVGIAAAPAGLGYWLLSASGAVRPVGSARRLGSVPHAQLVAPAVAIATAPVGTGYWVATANGAVHSFGSAQPLGSVPGPDPARTTVGIASLP